MTALLRCLLSTMRLDVAMTKQRLLLKDRARSRERCKKPPIDRHKPTFQTIVLDPIDALNSLQRKLFGRAEPKYLLNVKAVNVFTSGLHMQLLPRLASYRGRWQNDRLEGALADAIEHLRTARKSPSQSWSLGSCLSAKLPFSSCFFDSEICAL